MKYLFENNGKFFIHHHEKTWNRNIMEENKWLNVQNVEPKIRSQRRHGKWLDAQTSKEKECNWKSDYMNAQNAMLATAKF